MKLDLDNGANIETLDSKHIWTPLSLAKDQGHSDVVALIQERSAQVHA